MTILSYPEHTDLSSLLDARRHVNKMCLAADVPLIESGTAGFIGQVQPIKKVCLVGAFRCVASDTGRTSYAGSDRMLRLPAKGNSKRLSNLHNPKYSQHSYSLHSMGKELLVSVS